MTAERELWNHIPLAAKACDGALQPLDGKGAARAFNNASASTVGSARFRATFYEYTDATFTTRKVRRSTHCLIHAYCACCPCHMLPRPVLRAQSAARPALQQPNTASHGHCHKVVAISK